MEAMFAAGALLHPVALFILALVLFAAVSIGGQAKSLPVRAPRWALARGLFAVFVVSLVIAATSAYVSPEESRRLVFNQKTTQPSCVASSLFWLCSPLTRRSSAAVLSAPH